jgi:hypothetical protein
VILILCSACKEQSSEQSVAQESNTVFNAKLANELDSMSKIDQIAAYIPQGKYKSLSNEELLAFKDSVFKTHQITLKDIVAQYGYPGVDLVGEEGSRNFWLMVQHFDHVP